MKEIYGENIPVEAYTLGDSDVKTQLLKLKNRGSQAVINVAFEGDTLNALKVLKEQDLNMLYGTVDDSITLKVTEFYSTELEGSYSFGFADVSETFSDKISSERLTTTYGAALAYTHTMQMGKALATCGKDMDCVKNEIDYSEKDNTIGFQKFDNRIAIFSMDIKER